MSDAMERGLARASYLNAHLVVLVDPPPINRVGKEHVVRRQLRTLVRAFSAQGRVRACVRACTLVPPHTRGGETEKPAAPRSARGVPLASTAIRAVCAQPCGCRCAPLRAAASGAAVQHATGASRRAHTAHESTHRARTGRMHSAPAAGAAGRGWGRDLVSDMGRLSVRSRP